MGKFQVSPWADRAGVYVNARRLTDGGGASRQLFRIGDELEIAPEDYKSDLPTPGTYPFPLIPMDREAALALGWDRRRVDANFPLNANR
jgi:hypothetical protein